MSREKSVQLMLFLAGSFFLILALIHLTDIRLGDIVTLWPESALAYSKHLTRLFGSFALALALVSFVLCTNPLKYKNLVLLSAFWGLFHAALLIFNSLNMPFDILFQATPSLKVWLPSYNINALIEAVICILYTGVIFNWFFRLKK